MHLFTYFCASIKQKMVRKKKLGTYPNLMMVFSLTIALFMIGVCGLLTIEAKKLTQIVKQNLEIQAYLEKDLTPQQRDSIQRILAQKSYVARSEAGQPMLRFVSKDEAAQKFIKETREDFKELLLNENPLRDAYMIKVKEEFFEEAQLQRIKADLAKTKGVFEVTYIENFADDVNRNVGKIYLILSGFVLLLLLVIVVLVNNTIRLAFYSQRMLIRSMQLVGATNGFIRRPYLRTASIQGLMGGILACVLLYLLQQAAVYQVPEMINLLDNTKFVILCVALVLLGVAIGLACTFRSVERYMSVALDDLY
jgi:cell division transport system permease protein